MQIEKNGREFEKEVLPVISPKEWLKEVEEVTEEKERMIDANADWAPQEK